MNLDSNNKYKSKKRSFFEYIKRMRMMELLEKDKLKRRWKNMRIATQHESKEGG